jgi:hypothetical protein
VAFERAFAYIFDDPKWIEKLGLIAAVTLAAIITTPLLGLGLIVGWALLLGYQVELIRNVRGDEVYPLPRWDNLGEKLQKGGNVLVATILYNLPNVLPACCILATSSAWADGGFGTTFSLAFFCCLIPLALIYNLITWPMLTLGMARYAEEGNIGVFFQFGDLFNTLYRAPSVSIQWMVYALITNLIIGVVGAIPCIGWLAAPPLAIAVQGHLTAQLAMRIEGDLKPKRKNSAIGF